MRAVKASASDSFWPRPIEVPQRLERFHEFQIGIRGALERPTRAEQSPSAVVFGGDFQPDRAGRFLRDRHARWRHPYARQRATKTGIFKRLARSVAALPVADQQQFEAAGPVGSGRAVDVFGCDVEGLPLALHQPVKTVAADLLALEPAVGRQPRHRGAHHGAVDVECLEEFQQRAEPDRTAARHDGIAEQRDDDRAGARRLALELFDDAGKRLRHA